MPEPADPICPVCYEEVIHGADGKLSNVIFSCLACRQPLHGKCCEWADQWVFYPTEDATDFIRTTRLPCKQCLGETIDDYYGAYLRRRGGVP